MANLISAAKGLGASERELAKLKTQREYRKSITQDISSALAQVANIADAKAFETENFQAGEKLLQESDSFQKIEDVTEFSWKNPKSWGKQEGYKYDDRMYDKEQVMTLGESWNTLGAAFDDSQKANLLSNWKKMNKGTSTFAGETSVGDSPERTYQKSFKKSDKTGDRNKLLADRQDEYMELKEQQKSESKLTDKERMDKAYKDASDAVYAKSEQDYIESQYIKAGLNPDGTPKNPEQTVVPEHTASTILSEIDVPILSNIDATLSTSETTIPKELYADEYYKNLGFLGKDDYFEKRRLKSLGG